LALGASGHIVMDYPRPYGFIPNGMSQDPLTMANFPCNAPNFDIVQVNAFKAGEQQPVNFNGSATHGGGSCQFAITTDLQPSKSTRWGVIHSIEGNCPAVNVPGNLSPEGKDTQGPDRYPLVIPKDVPNGLLTLSWTWINHQGRYGEFYMNCAPIVVSGGAEANDKSLKYLNDLPTMFVANLDQTCLTATGGGDAGDIVYPEGFVGDSVVKKPGLKPASFLSTQGCASMTKMGAGSGTMTAPQQQNNTNVPTAKPSSVAGMKIYAPSGGEQAPVPTGGAPASGAPSSPPAAPSQPAPSSAAAPSVTEAPAAPSEAPAPMPSSAATVAPSAPAPSAPAATGGAPSAGKVSCPAPGAVICVSDKMFGICGADLMAMPQPVAEGTSCTGGSIA
ncbi:hypothetical protein EJ04DRAFT_397396, partial [Polyplosphaeria fusca]